MILDSLWLFSGGTGGVGNGDGVTDSPTTGTQNSSNIVDVGIVSGLPTSANGGGGRDLGIGDYPALKLMILVTTTFLSGTSLQVGVQGAPDNGAGAPGAYQTYATGPVVAEAQLIAGARLFDDDLPRMAPMTAATNPPRYYRLTYINVGTHTAGKIEATLVLDRIDQIETTNAVLSGYPAGITVAN